MAGLNEVACAAGAAIRGPNVVATRVAALVWVVPHGVVAIALAAAPLIRNSGARHLGGEMGVTEKKEGIALNCCQHCCF